MTGHHAANWLLAILGAGVLSASLWLDGPSLAESETDTAADVAAATAAARQAARTACPDVTHCLPAFKRPRIAYSEGAAK